MKKNENLSQKCANCRSSLLVSVMNYWVPNFFLCIIEKLHLILNPFVKILSDVCQIKV